MTKFLKKPIVIILGSLIFILAITSPKETKELETIPQEDVVIVQEVVALNLDQPEDQVEDKIVQEEIIVKDEIFVAPTQQEIKTIVPAVTSNSYKVTSVVDGDTVKINLNGTIETIRIIGINTPETVDPRKPVECFGKEASDKAKSLLTNQTIIIEQDLSQGDRDKYGRLLRYIILPNGKDYGLEMISGGYAYEYTYDKPYSKQSLYKSAQNTAQTNKVGLWGEDVCNEDQNNTPTPTTTSGVYYTSSYHTSKYYYPESCDGWKGLSEKYLESYSSLSDLISVYPEKTLSPQCE